MVGRGGLPHGYSYPDRPHRRSVDAHPAAAPTPRSARSSPRRRPPNDQRYPLGTAHWCPLGGLAAPLWGIVDLSCAAASLAARGSLGAALARFARTIR